jgi:hypothetical protein
MVPLARIRDLNLAAASSPGRRPHLSAASGLVCIRTLAYVIADDELDLGVFGTDTGAPGQLVRLFDGEALAHAPEQRKGQKPDIEAIALLPADAGHPHGALLVLGSGSRPNRHRGAILTLDAAGHIAGLPRVLDLSPVYAALHREFSELNIEGAAVAGDEIHLLQRGNKGTGRNAMIRFALGSFLNTLKSENSGIAPAGIAEFALGGIDGIPFCFTDATALPDGRLLFTAVAEDTGNAYEDGRCLGSAIGIIADGTLRRLERADRPCKIEGVHAQMSGGRIELLLVTDADNADLPGELLRATLDW